MGIHRRQLSESVVVDNVDDLKTALAGSAPEVRLAAGVYYLSEQLEVSRDVTITADVEGSSVVLDGQGATRVMRIVAEGVSLSGLNITRGNASASPLDSGGGVFIHRGSANITPLLAATVAGPHHHTTPQ